MCEGSAIPAQRSRSYNREFESYSDRVLTVREEHRKDNTVTFGTQTRGMEDYDKGKTALK